jgi:hypothetical protein
VRPRAWLRHGAELFALCGIAIAQPILDVFGREPAVFIDVDAAKADLWVFAIVVAFGPPLVLAIAELVIGVVTGELNRVRAHLLLVALLGTLALVRILRLAADVEGPLLLGLALVTTALLVVAYARLAGVRTWIGYAAFAPIVFVGLFVFSSPASSLARNQGGRGATAISLRPEAAGVVRPPVVLLVLDEFPVRALMKADGTIDAERFPGFARLAAGSSWFRNATGAGSHTDFAVPPIFTGQNPPETRAPPIAASYPDSMFRLLGNAYRFNVTELVTVLCAVDRCDPDDPANAPTTTTAANASDDTVGKSRRTTRGNPLRALLRRVRSEYPKMVALHEIEPLTQVDPGEFATVTTTTTTTTVGPVAIESVSPTTIHRVLEHLPAVQPDRFAGWLDRIDGDATRPALNVLHLTLPHHPWHLDSTGTSYRFPDDDLYLVGLADGAWLDDPGPALAARQRFLLQARYTDGLVSAMIDRLDRLGLWDKALVIVTADHGAGLDPNTPFRDWRPVGATDVVGVPLFVRGSGFEAGLIDDRPAQAVDVMPTIAAAASVEIPWGIDGVDLAHLPQAARLQHPYGAVSFGEYRLVDLDVSAHLETLLGLGPLLPAAGGDDLTILRAGPAGDLIGLPIADRPMATDRSRTVTLEFPTDGSFGRDDAGAVGAFIVGHVSATDSNSTIVVMLDGNVAATALTFDADGIDGRFLALIPPEWLTRADHAVSFYLLDRDGLLVPLDIA